MINDYITSLITYALNENLIKEEDKIFVTNQLIALLELDAYEEGKVLDIKLNEILDGLCNEMIKRNLLNDNIVERDLFDTAIMGLFIDRPSNIIDNFNRLYKESPISATDYFYHLAITSNYIRKDRILKDLKWKTDTPYGILDITINLSKPEKDPKMIAMQKNMPASSYPKCLLCKENEGYHGRLNHPARNNIRLIPLKLNDEDFYMQYSPYVYYNEHCIVLSKDHNPMTINKKTFKRLLDFTDYLPHYFLGSNADLPIVGGSILAHEHYQGGHYTFAMDNAKVIESYALKSYQTKLEILKWPLSVIRLKGLDKEEITNIADNILQKWIDYSDEEVFIYAYTDGIRHNTITPIARRDNEYYVLDLVLRNNIQTAEYPLGYFHPHKEYHHLKKENIGLIEVMGLAVLPSRLKEELSLVKMCLLNNTDLSLNEKTSKHKEWAENIKSSYDINEANIDSIIEKEVGIAFMHILEDAGVFKQTNDGIKHFKKFVKSLDQ